MHRFITFLSLATCFLGLANSAAQQTTTSVPNLISYSGTLNQAPDSTLSSHVVGMTFCIYSQQDGGVPVWMEMQNINVDADGHYRVLLGSTKPDGLPSDLFSAQEQRWLGVQPAGQPEQPRILMVSVPYALKAHEAETLGGLSVEAFVRAQPSTNSSQENSGTSDPVDVKTNSANNTFIGASAGQSNTTGANNAFAGFGAGFLSTTGSGNSFFGEHAGYYNTTGSSNTYLGQNAGGGVGNATGSLNVFVGVDSGSQFITGDNNVFLGSSAGYNLHKGSNNIYLANEGPTGGRETNVIRIGSQQTAAYVAGIYGKTPSAALPVVINADGQLGTAQAVNPSPSTILDSETINRGNLIFVPEPNPVAPIASLVLDGGTGQCTPGTHSFIVQLVTSIGRTGFSPPSNTVTCDATHKTVLLTNVATGTPGVVTGRDIGASKYNDPTGTAYFYLVGTEPTIPDNTATTFMFAAADSSMHYASINQNTTAGQIQNQAGNYVSNYSLILGTQAGASEIPLDAAYHSQMPLPYNVFVGDRAGYSNIPSPITTCWGSFSQGTHNTYIGSGTARNSTTGCLNTDVGNDAASQNTTGYANTRLGVDAGQLGVSANYVTMVGVLAGQNNLVDGTTAVGFSSGQENTTGSGNTFVGYASGISGTTGKNNTALGTSSCAGALVDGTNTGSNNVCIGYRSAPAAKGAYNTVGGAFTGNVLTTGYGNAFWGYSAGTSTTTGVYNTYLGSYAGGVNQTGSYNIALGFWANQSGINNLTGAIAIGTQSSNTASHQAVIGGDSANGYVDNLYLGRSVTSLTPQPTMTIHATDARSTADVAGTQLNLAPGVGLGAAKPAMACTYGTVAGTPGTIPQSSVIRHCENDYKVLTSGVATTVLSVPLATLQVTGGTLDFAIRAQDGSNNCIRAGRVRWAGENSGGAIVTSASWSGDDAFACTVGAMLTSTWTFTVENPAQLQVTAVTNMNPITLDITYSFTNNGATTLIP